MSFFPPFLRKQESIPPLDGRVRGHGDVCCRVPLIWFDRLTMNGEGGARAGLFPAHLVSSTGQVLNGQLRSARPERVEGPERNGWGPVIPAYERESIPPLDGRVRGHDDVYCLVPLIWFDRLTTNGEGGARAGRGGAEWALSPAHPRIRTGARFSAGNTAHIELVRDPQPTTTVRPRRSPAVPLPFLPPHPAQPVGRPSPPAA